MGRLSIIESTAAGSLPTYANMKMIVRGRPRFLDPQLDIGTTRFSLKRGSNFTAMIANNQAQIAEDAYKASRSITLVSRPSWIDIQCLIRLGISEEVGELHIVNDLVDSTGLSTVSPLISNYFADSSQGQIPVVSLVGVPITVFAAVGGGLSAKRMLVDSWYPVVPGDTFWISPTPEVLESLSPYQIVFANPISSRPGAPGTGEPSTVYQYEIELGTKTGLLPFVPAIGTRMYLRAQPLFYRGPYGSGSISIPNNVGPCLLDVFSGSLLASYEVGTQIGIQTWDDFGQQVNLPFTGGGQPWQAISPNHLMLERPISSDTLLFWQRIEGNLQFQKQGFFQAELNSSGRFILSTDLLVPKWPTDIQRGWVIPILSRAPLQLTIQFEPQEPQIFTIPSNVLTFIRPKILASPTKTPIDRVVLALLGSPNAKVEIRDWQFDGSAVSSISYYILGTKQAYGENRWMAGGFSLKPLFYNLDVLRARYSDGIARYNHGYIYV